MGLKVYGLRVLDFGFRVQGLSFIPIPSGERGGDVRALAARNPRIGFRAVDGRRKGGGTVSPQGLGGEARFIKLVNTTASR